MKNRKAYLVILVFILLIIIALLFIRNSENYWVCQDGKWIKHGNPEKSMPVDACKKEPTSENNIVKCSKFNEKTCPDTCVVCPPCAACSSISCQTPEFCSSIGFDKSWYEDIKKNLNNLQTNENN